MADEDLTRIVGEEFKELFMVYGEACISRENGKECYGKPCACYACRPVGYCVEDHCLDCSGRDEERSFIFCGPPQIDEFGSEEDMAPI